eukprot:scaffold53078_cov72-Attheya_sp.AAC.3
MMVSAGRHQRGHSGSWPIHHALSRISKRRVLPVIALIVGLCCNTVESGFFQARRKHWSMVRRRPHYQGQGFVLRSNDPPLNAKHGSIFSKQLHRTTFFEEKEERIRHCDPPSSSSLDRSSSGKRHSVLFALDNLPKNRLSERNKRVFSTSLWNTCDNLQNAADSSINHRRAVISGASMISWFLLFHKTSGSAEATEMDTASGGYLLLGNNNNNNNDNLEEICRNGAIAAVPMDHGLIFFIKNYIADAYWLLEGAVPGAYQQVCMALPERTIQLKSCRESVTIAQGSSLSGGSSSSVTGRTGVAVWNSCLLLVRLLDMGGSAKQLWKDKVVWELGCGTALASIVAAKLGARRVVATNGAISSSNDDILALAKSNVQRNHVEDVVQIMPLQWGALDA